MKQKGFSLIEVMISIAIIGVIGVISTAIFTQTLKTSSQTETISKLRQNGDQAVSVIEESIRNANAVICVTSSGGVSYTMVIRTIEGKYTKFRFSEPVGTPVTQNGYIARQDNLSTTSLTDPSLVSAFCNLAPNTSNEVILTNNDLSSGVNISNGKFLRKSPGYLGKDTIEVDFSVNQTKTAKSSVGGESADMSTTIQVR